MAEKSQVKPTSAIAWANALEVSAAFSTGFGLHTTRTKVTAWDLGELARKATLVSSAMKVATAAEKWYTLRGDDDAPVLLLENDEVRGWRRRRRQRANSSSP